MSQKVLLGAVVLAGGAYLYDKNVAPIFPQEKARAQYEIQKLDEKTKVYGQKLTDTLQDTKQELTQRTKDLKHSVEKSELYQQVKIQSQDLQDQADTYAKYVKQSLNDENTSAFVSAVHAYIDKVNEWAGATTPAKDQEPFIAPDRSWWEKYFGAEKKDVEETLNQIQSDVESAKSSWFNWGSQKVDEASQEAQKQTNIARDEYYKQKQSLDSSYNDLKDTTSKLYEEKKNTAIATYESARKDFEDVANSLSSPAKQAKLDSAKLNLDNALADLQSYGSDVVNEITKKFK